MLFLPAVLAGALLGVPVTPVRAAPACAGVTAGQARAVALAASCEKAVVVAESRAELTQVIAQPDGRLTKRLAVGGDVALGQDAEGTLRVTAGGTPVAEAG